MKENITFHPPIQPPNVLAELQKMHKQTLQRLDMLVELQRLMLQELKDQAKEKGSD